MNMDMIFVSGFLSGIWIFGSIILALLILNDVNEILKDTGIFFKVVFILFWPCFVSFFVVKHVFLNIIKTGKMLLIKLNPRRAESSIDDNLESFLPLVNSSNLKNIYDFIENHWKNNTIDKKDLLELIRLVNQTNNLFLTKGF